MASQIRRAIVMAPWLVVMGCGGDDGQRPDSVEVTEQTGEVPAEPDEAAAGASDAYCDAITAIVTMPVEQIQVRRAPYRDAVAAVLATSPADHADAWTAMLEFVDDDASERLNPAADGLDHIGPQVERDCGIRLVLEDWDVLRDQPLADAPGVYEG